MAGLRRDAVRRSTMLKVKDKFVAERILATARPPSYRWWWQVKSSRVWVLAWAQPLPPSTPTIIYLRVIDLVSTPVCWEAATIAIKLVAGLWCSVAFKINNRFAAERLLASSRPSSGGRWCHWQHWSSLRYNQASVPDPYFGPCPARFIRPTLH